MKNCKNCEYRKHIARVFNIHIDEYDCWFEKCLLENEENNEKNNIEEEV